MKLQLVLDIQSIVPSGNQLELTLPTITVSKISAVGTEWEYNLQFDEISVFSHHEKVIANHLLIAQL